QPLPQRYGSTMQGQSPSTNVEAGENASLERQRDRELARLSLRRPWSAICGGAARVACFVLVSSCAAPPRDVQGPSRASALPQRVSPVSVPRTIVTKDSATGIDEI